MQYMQQRCGAWQVGDDAERGAAQFKLFLPAGFDPHIASIKIVGSFQNQLPSGDATMIRSESDEGTLYTYTTPVQLEGNFYQYKYLVTFDDGTARRISDPCTRYAWQTQFNPAGFGVDTARQVVLNFSREAQWVSIPFPENGPWTDLIANIDGSFTAEVTDLHRDVMVGSNWGHIFFRED
jgi:1,4-alpha-glucan branching enzyme